MVQHVRGVHPELERFGLGEFEILAEICIETECSGHVEVVLSETALSSWFRVLQNNQAVLGWISRRVSRSHDSPGRSRRNDPRDGIELASQTCGVSRLACSRRWALWIGERDVRIVLAEEASFVGGAIPVKIGFSYVEVSDDIHCDVGNSG